MVVYQFNCFCEDSYVRTTFRQFGKRVKEHDPKSIEDFCKMSNKKNKSVWVVNASKRSAIAEHLVNNSNCASNYNLNWFKLLNIVLTFPILLNLKLLVL